jgi:hypothetical protein
MNQNKVFAILSILLIIPVIIFVIVNNKKQHSQELLEKNREIESFSVNYNVLKSNFYLMSKLSCTHINKELRLVSKSGKHFFFRDILSDSISHILFIPPMFCSSCNERVLPDIVESFGNKLKVISHPSSVNSVINYCKNKISHDNLFIMKELIIEEHEKINMVYILSITNLGQIKSIFFINGTDLKSFEEYLEFCLKITPCK